MKKAHGKHLNDDKDLCGVFQGNHYRVSVDEKAQKFHVFLFKKDVRHYNRQYRNTLLSDAKRILQRQFKSFKTVTWGWYTG